MKRMKGVKAVIAIVIATLLAILAFSCVAPAPKEKVAPKTTTIVDSAGEAVEVPKPTKKLVVLNSDAAQVIRALGAKDRIIAAEKYWIDDPYWPDLGKLPNVGSRFRPNYEKILELKPEVVITYTPWKYKEIRKKLGPAGIKVAAIDCYKPKSLYRDIRVLGLMLGKEKEAKEYIDFLKSWLDPVEKKGKGDIKPKERKAVYCESRKAYHSCAEGSGWHELIYLIGGVNIFAGSPSAYPEVDPEAVLEKNPDFVIKVPWIHGWIHGFTLTSPDKLRKIREEMIDRPGWDTLKAVKEGKVYVVTREIAGGAGKPVGICYLAKALYPKKFPELHPKDFLKKFLEYQGLPYQGIYLYPKVQ